jgi:dGTP triphosphohydrolase
MSPAYSKKTPPALKVRDYLAGMTDDFFLRQAQILLMPATII